MVRKPSQNLAGRELEIMPVLWSLGPTRRGEVQEILNRQGSDPGARPPWPRR